MLGDQLTNCARCHKNVAPIVRQTWACAFEPPPTFRLPVVPWTGCGVDYRPATDDEPAFPSVCPGFTTALPEVIETARARAHWTNGELTQFCDGPATQQMLYALETLQSAENLTQRWALDNPIKKAK